jgi:hypothetical protein
MKKTELQELYHQLGADLADVLMRWARDRRDDDKKLIGQLQRDLCMLRRAEIADPSPDDHDEPRS